MRCVSEYCGDTADLWTLAVKQDVPKLGEDVGPKSRSSFCHKITSAGWIRTEVCQIGLAKSLLLGRIPKREEQNPRVSNFQRFGRASAGANGQSGRVRVDVYRTCAPIGS